jgi:hypothetical protein
MMRVRHGKDLQLFIVLKRLMDCRVKPGNDSKNSTDGAFTANGASKKIDKPVTGVTARPVETGYLWLTPIERELPAVSGARRRLNLSFDYFDISVEHY